MNILFARCTTSGHHHATWNVIAEALEIKEKTKDLYQKIVPIEDELLKRREAVKITQRMLQSIPSIVHGIATASEESQQPFLYDKFKTPLLCSFTENDFSNNPHLWTQHSKAASRQLDYSLLPSLTDFWRRSSNFNEPLEFSYDSGRGILQPQNTENYDDDLERHRISVPTRGIGSFVPDEHYLRLNILGKKEAARALTIDVGYAMRFPTSGKQTKNSTIGLTRKLADGIASLNIDLFHARNMIKSQTVRREAGSIRFIGHTSPNEKVDFEGISKNLSSTLAAVQKQGLSMAPPIVRSLAVDRLFLSTHLTAGRLNEISEVIETCANKYGFELTSVNTPYRNVTQEVLSNLRDCAGLIQVLTVREMESSTRKRQPEISWLIAEYFAALALEVPSLRLVDLSVMSEDEWRSYLRIATERPLLGFDSRSGNLREFMGKEIERFLNKIREEAG